MSFSRVRVRRVTEVQKIVLLTYMESHIDVSFGKRNTFEERLKLDKIWEALTVQLNSIGTRKSKEQWQKVWRDFKIKGKHLLSDAQCKYKKNFTNFEQRIIAIVKKERDLDAKIRHSQRDIIGSNMCSTENDKFDNSNDYTNSDNFDSSNDFIIDNEDETQNFIKLPSSFEIQDGDSIENEETSEMVSVENVKASLTDIDEFDQIDNKTIIILKQPKQNEQLTDETSQTKSATKIVNKNLDDNIDKRLCAIDEELKIVNRKLDLSNRLLERIATALEYQELE